MFRLRPTFARRSGPRSGGRQVEKLGPPTVCLVSRQFATSDGGANGSFRLASDLGGSGDGDKLGGFAFAHRYFPLPVDNVLGDNRRSFKDNIAAISASFARVFAVHAINVYRLCYPVLRTLWLAVFAGRPAFRADPLMTVRKIVSSCGSFVFHRAPRVVGCVAHLPLGPRPRVRAGKADSLESFPPGGRVVSFGPNFRFPAVLGFQLFATLDSPTHVASNFQHASVEHDSVFHRFAFRVLLCPCHVFIIT